MDAIVRENFKKLREQIGLSQEQMAQYLMLEQSSISKFENGSRPLQMNSLEKACSLFGIPVNELFKNESKIKVLAPSFRKSELSNSSLDDIAKINKIASNIIEMKTILEKHNNG